MKTANLTRTLIVMSMGLTSLATRVSAQYAVDWQTVDGGGAQSTSGGSFTLSGTIGQPDAAPATTPMMGGSFSLFSGFWPAFCFACEFSAPADLDRDCDIDQADFAILSNCSLGPGVPSGEVGDCQRADLDRDSDADQDDFGLFQRCYTGPDGQITLDCED